MLRRGGSRCECGIEWEDLGKESMASLKACRLGIEGELARPRLEFMFERADFVGGLLVMNVEVCCSKTLMLPRYKGEFARRRYIRPELSCALEIDILSDGLVAEKACNLHQRRRQTTQRTVETLRATT